MRRTKIKGVQVNIHPNLYKKMEELRKVYSKQNIRVSQIELTEILSKRLKKMKKIDLIGGKR